MQTTWRTLISGEMKDYGESWDDIESCTLTDEQLDQSFDPGYGREEGDPFTVWTAKRVYFPACYDGSEWCTSVSRHPDGERTSHVGGG